MHDEILTTNQAALLPFIKKYKKKYFLVGGTAIALYIGHRRSIDFDLLTFEKINSTGIKRQVADSGFKSAIVNSLSDQIHFILNEVKITFFEFPFEIVSDSQYKDYCKMPDLLTLSAMKAFALGGRGKWKDYVDLYFILKNHYSAKDISFKAKTLFNDSFNPLLFKKQICYFDDINYSEAVEYMPGFSVPEEEIKSFLIDAALTGF
jgi:Nucleotidyl transferase AbiEii toxin, Type IV TA system